MRMLRIGTFSPSVLLEVASVTGRLDAADLEVVEVPTRSSPEQFDDLFEGRLDAALTNPDNVLAYRCVPSNPLGRTGDVRILSAVDRGLGLALFTGPTFPSTDDIRGTTVAVDVRGSGFAFVCFELLARRGLVLDVDYSVTALGATPLRTEALLAGRCSATVLNAGNELMAESMGAHRISSVPDIGPYAGAVLAATGTSIRDNRAALGSLVAVLTDTASGIASGSLDVIVVDAIRRRLKLSDAAAAEHLAVLTNPTVGLVTNGRLTDAELRTVVGLRRRYASADVADVAEVKRSGLVDTQFLNQTRWPW